MMKLLDDHNRPRKNILMTPNTNVLVTILASGLVTMAGSAVADSISDDTEIDIVRSWSQEPGGWRYPMTIGMPDEDEPDGGFPVCILLHGNGGQGDQMVNQFRGRFDRHVLVAPSGYERSWNICDEGSEAPDVDMVGELVEILQGYDNVNPNAIRILGFSNGSALANSIYLENQNPGIDAVCAVVSQLSDVQYRDGDFRATPEITDPSRPFCGYDQTTIPLVGRRLLSICNENDNVIPYNGGFSNVGLAFIPARAAVYEIARSQGYRGSEITGSGIEIGDSNVFEYSYLKDRVVHLRGFAGHGSNPTQDGYVIDFFADWPILDDTIPGDLNGDDRVDGADLGLLVAGWGTIFGDLTGDGTTNGTDIGILLAHWTG